MLESTDTTAKHGPHGTGGAPVMGNDPPKPDRYARARQLHLSDGIPMPEPSTRRPVAWVLAGLLATCWMVAVQWADAPGLLEARASWWRVAVQLPCALLLLLAWWKLGPTMRRPLLTAALWAAPMLVALPMHSRDAYSYAAQGWLMAHGQDPYLTPSGEAGLPGLFVGMHWFHTTSVYPVVSLWVFEAMARLADFHPFWTVVALRLPNLLALAVVAWALARIADHVGIDRRHAWWMGVANPVILVQWIGGVHNDALMVAGIAVALACVVRTGWLPLVLGGVALGTAMGFKQAAALAGLGLVAVAWQARRRVGAQGWPRLFLTAVVPGAVTLATFLGLSWASGLGLGWNNPTAGSPIGASSNAPWSWVASFGRFHDLAEDAVVNDVLSTVATCCILVAIVALAWWLGPRADADGRPWLFLVLSLLAFGFVGPALQPWYLTWAIPFAAFARLEGWWRWGWTALVAAFVALPPLQDAMPPYVAMGVVLIPIIAAGWAARR